MKIVLITLMFFLVSCANYVNQLHRQIDSEERGSVRQAGYRGYDPYAMYRNTGMRRKDRRPINNPVTYRNNPQDQMNNTMAPPIKRDYRPLDKRVQAKDFIDNDNTGSLWANQGSASNLFSGTVQKKLGDIILVNVMENLRNQISAELKRAFPEPPKKKKDGDKKKDKDKGDQASTAQAAPQQKEEDDHKVFDKISGVVVEEVSKDYLLIKAKKEVVFRKEKRFIEVQALVSRKDIMDNDTVNSDQVLESRVIILR